MSEAEVEDIKNAKEKLMTSAQNLFSKMYEQAQGAAGAAGMNPEDFANAAGAGATAGPADDNVVDGDYKEI